MPVGGWRVKGDKRRVGGAAGNTVTQAGKGAALSLLISPQP